MTTILQGTGIWSGALRYGDPGAAAAAAAELDDIGYTAVWLPDVGGEVFAAIENVLAVTTRLTAATGILNIWMHSPETTASEHARLTGRHGPRFLVGLGVSHGPLIDRVKEAGAYTKPLARMEAYLDGLDAAVPPLVPADRVLAALGPKMLELARTRCAGVHPYLVTPEHTRLAREAIGPGGLVATEQAVAVTTDPDEARRLGRIHLATYLGLPNYTNNWRRLGFTDDDLADGGSNRLVDAMVAWGGDAAIARRVQEHRDAGADHVCIQVLSGDPSTPPIEVWRALAPALVV